MVYELCAAQTTKLANPIRWFQMKRVALLVALALCLPLSARADDASLHAKAKELVTLLHTDRMVAQLSDTLKKRADDAAEKAIGATPTPENKAKLTDFEKTISDTIDAQLGWSAMEAAVTEVYAKTFTEDELSAIIAFYKSPAGIAFLEKTPEVNAGIKDLSTSKLNAAQTQLNQAFIEFRKSLAAPAAPAATPAAPAATTPN